MQSPKLFQDPNKIEVGVDEVARGCLFGRVYAAAVIWGKQEISFPVNRGRSVMVKDSKKLSPKQREILYDYITQNAISYAVAWCDEKDIDKHNILQATMIAMHQALNNLSVQPDMILVDGTYFKPYIGKNGDWISYQCIPKGDSEYFSIACASIIAKVEHDRYIKQLCENEPLLDEKYGLLSNMGYGSRKHMDGLKNYGTCEYHRMSYKPCRGSSEIIQNFDEECSS